MIRAVTFDYWNTLCRVDSSRTARRRKEAWHTVARERSIAVADEVLDAVLDHVSARHHEGWLANEQFTATHALATATELLREVLAPGDAEALRDAWFDASAAAEVALTPHCAEVLDALVAREVRLGIVCDVGLSPSVLLRGFLDAHGVLDRFSHWSFSDDVGVYKPHPAIFAHALAGLEVTAAEALHIGDLRRTDVAGAVGAGMTAVRYRAVADDDDPSVPDAPHVLDDLRELVALLDARV